MIRYIEIIDIETICGIGSYRPPQCGLIFDRHAQFLSSSVDFIFLNSNAGNKEFSYGKSQINSSIQYRYLTT